ncbi:MAG: hypothetical protein WBQ75_14080 [Acetobacteraceae bacterium]
MGKPSVKTRALKGQAVRQYNDMRLNLFDLEFCNRILIENIAILRGKPSDMYTALWIAVLTKFFACFGDSESRRTLNPKKVFKNNEVAMIAFRRLQNIRNKHIVHDANNIYQSNAVIQIIDGNVDKDFKCIIVGSSFVDTEMDRLMMLIDVSISHVSNAIGNLANTIKGDLEEMSVEDILQLKEWHYDAKAAMFDVGENRIRFD